jgi:hypothetical protein
MEKKKPMASFVLKTLSAQLGGRERRKCHEKGYMPDVKSELEAKLEG